MSIALSALRRADSLAQFRSILERLSHTFNNSDRAKTRTFSNKASGHNFTLEGLLKRERPQLVPFQLSKEEAVARFEAWHKQHYFSPTGLLQNATVPMRAAYLPFWLFYAEIQVRYTGQVGFKKPNNDIEWQSVGWIDKGLCTYDWTSDSMQVYASYQYRRDYAATLKTSNFLASSRALREEEAFDLISFAEPLGMGAELDPPDVKQSIAWDLACKVVRQRETEIAEKRIQNSSGSDFVRDVQVKLKVTKRAARLSFVPAFIMEYQYGEVFDPHGHRKPYLFQAIISGVQNYQVAAERHVSPWKVQFGAAFATGSVVSAAVLVGLHNHETLSLASSFLSALLICTSAGLAARLAPELIRQGAEDERIQIEDAQMEKIMSQGMGPGDIMDDKHEALRDLSEWQRWEEANKWAWEGKKRRRWAEALWLRQHTRKIQMAEYARNKVKAEAKFQFEQENEARRRARYGASSQVFNQFSDGSGQKDFKGYYALLGLDGSLRGAISQPDIKAAFRKSALRWHPDQLKVSSEKDRQRAYVQFSKVQRAYDVLRNSEKRREYDSGIDPS